MLINIPRAGWEINAMLNTHSAGTYTMKIIFHLVDQHAPSLSFGRPRVYACFPKTNLLEFFLSSKILAVESRPRRSRGHTVIISTRRLEPVLHTRLIIIRTNWPPNGPLWENLIRCWKVVPFERERERERVCIMRWFIRPFIVNSAFIFWIR